LLEKPDRTWTWPSEVVHGSPDRQDPDDAPTEEPKKGDAKKSGRQVDWLTDPRMLTKAFPGARIIRFNYGWERPGYTYDIRLEAAHQLLHELTMFRKDSFRFPPKPILLIGHSFGGVVIQTALVLGNQESRRPFVARSEGDFDHWEAQRRMLDAIAGVLFFATPFKISSAIRERWRIDANVELISPKHPDPEPLKVTYGPALPSTVAKHMDAEDGDEFNTSFTEIAQEQLYRVACFFEKPRNPGKAAHATVRLID
jgi:pimeloyl-ACP methyl ester carboxylesterase